MTDTQLHSIDLNVHARGRMRRARAVSAGMLFFAPVDVVLDWPARAMQEMAAMPQRRGWLPVAERAAQQLRRSEAAVIATFILETTAGRDAIAAAVLDVVRDAGDRKGFDGLFATVVRHLQVTRSDRLAAGTNLWSCTDNTAPTDRPVAVFDAATNTVTALGRDAFDSSADPFGRGLAVDSPIHRVGGETMDGEDTCKKVFEVLGAAVGEAGAGEFGELLGKAVGAVVCGDTSVPGGSEGGHGASGSPLDVDLPRDDPDTKETGKDTGGDPKPAGERPTEEKDEENKDKPDDGKGDGDDHPDKGGSGWPNPEEGYPAPDDGGGSPWSRVGVSTIPTLTDLASLATPTGENTFNVAPLMTALHSGTHGIDPSRGLFASLAGGGDVARVTQLRLTGVSAQLASASASVSVTVAAVTSDHL